MESPRESVEVVDYFAATTEKDEVSELVMEANLEQKVGQVADEHESLPHHLKRLFLYCSLFSSGYEFSKDELIQLWIAEGFIRERQNQRMEDTASEHFNSLETEGFFLLSRCDFNSLLSTPTGNFLYKVNPIKHSILEDTISSGNYFRAVDGNLDGASEMTRHLSLICEDIDEMTFGILQNFKHLRTLHLLSCHGSSIKHVPRDFCFTLTFLRTLNLSGTLISELPSSIGNVKSLRYIDASHTPISRLPESIDSLHKLQTIKLRGCIHFVQLPKGMKKLTNLRHIDLDIIRQLDSMPAHLGNLSNLQTLSAFLVGRDDGCHVGELKNLNDLNGALNISRLENVLSKEEAEEAALMDKKCLHTLELRWSNHFVEYAEQEEKILECFQPHFGLKELQIQQYSGSVLPTWISNPAFADLVVITLYGCRNCKLLPCLGQLPALKSLSIVEVNEVKEINHQFFRNGPVDHAFPKLERLEVNTMLNLKEWKDVQVGDFPSLVKFTLDSCSELVTLPALSWLKSLKHLELRRCPKLMSLPNDGLPTSLESFLIVDCLELKEWCLKSGHWSMLCHLPSIWFDHEEVKGPCGITDQLTLAQVTAMAAESQSYTQISSEYAEGNELIEKVMKKESRNVGKYKVGRTIGEGTFAKVKFARNDETGESVAMKVLAKSTILKHRMVEQIKNEISVMKIVRHPNIVRLHEVLASRTKIYIILELVTGGELFDKIVHEGKLHENESRKYFQQLIDAVSHCHSKGVYHRDLKPENLLLDAYGNLKVSDFGLSALPQQGVNLLYTTCGTPNYVAPEVLGSQGYDGAAADVWSCGVILYVLMAGYLPFHETNLSTLYRKINAAEFSCPSWFSPGANSLIHKILDPNPKTRIRIEGIKKDPWFRKNYVRVEHREDEEVSPDDVCAVFEDNEDQYVAEWTDSKEGSPSRKNAFEMNTLSQELNLSALFDRRRIIAAHRSSFLLPRVASVASLSRASAAASWNSFSSFHRWISPP